VPALPLLIVHSRDAEIIPCRYALRRFAAARAPQRLLSLRGGHNDGFLAGGGVYRDGMAAFLHACAPPLNRWCRDSHTDAPSDGLSGAVR